MAINNTGAVRTNPEVEQFILNGLSSEDRKVVQQFLREAAALQVPTDSSAPAARPAAKDVRQKHLGDEADAARELRLTSEAAFLAQLQAAYPDSAERMGDISKGVAKLVASSAGQTASSNGNVLASRPGSELQAKWGAFVADANAQFGAPMDVNALVQWVLRESYMQTTQDLYFYAEKVKFFNECKKNIRAELTAAREHLAKYAGQPDEAGITAWAAKGIASDFTGSSAGGEMKASLYSGESVNTKGKLDAYIKGLEEKLSSVGDDAQLANVDLQNVLQKQQQTIQLLSNISKMLHDTGMAIIRKVGG